LAADRGNLEGLTHCDSPLLEFFARGIEIVDAEGEMLPARGLVFRTLYEMNLLRSGVEPGPGETKIGARKHFEAEDIDVEAE